MSAGFVLAGFFLDPTPPPPISGGELAEGEPSVVALLAYDAEREAAALFCSGTLVSSDAVVTAAHCLDEADRLVEEEYRLVVASGVDLLRDGVIDAVEASAWVSHPSWEGFSVSGAPRFDVGVVSLERRLAGASVALLGETAPSDAWQGDRLELVGFGATSLGAGDGGTKRTVAVDYAGADANFLFIDSPGRNVCEGDSGGGMFRMDGSERALVGVHSYVYAGDPALDPCSEGQGASHRVDSVLDWIRKESQPQGVGGGEADGAPSGAVGSLDLEEPAGCAVGSRRTPRGPSWWALLGVLFFRRASGPFQRRVARPQLD